jgi:hypothetical protein
MRQAMQLRAKLKADVDAGRSVTPVGQNAAKAGFKPDCGSLTASEKRVCGA